MQKIKKTIFRWKREGGGEGQGGGEGWGKRQKTVLEQ